MCRCRRYIRFMRRVASIGHDEAAPISREYADIHAPQLSCVVHSLRCSRDKDVTDRGTAEGTVKILVDGAIITTAFAPAAVAKLQRARDILIGLLIRGMDEHSAHRGRRTQQPGRGRSDSLGQALRVLVSSPGLYADLGGSGSRSCGPATAARSDHRHDIVRRMQRAVISYGATGAGLCGRSQRGASFVAEAQACRYSRVPRLRRVLAVLRRGCLVLEFRTLPRAAAPDA